MDKLHTWKELNQLRTQRQKCLVKPFDSLSFVELEKINQIISKYVIVLINQDFCVELEK